MISKKSEVFASVGGGVVVVDFFSLSHSSLDKKKHDLNKKQKKAWNLPQKSLRPATSPTSASRQQATSSAQPTRKMPPTREASVVVIDFDN